MKIENRTLYYCPSKEAICLVESCANGIRLLNFPDYENYMNILNFEDGTKQEIYGSIGLKEGGCDDILQERNDDDEQFKKSIEDFTRRRQNLKSELEFINTKIKELTEEADEINIGIERINSEQNKLIIRKTKTDYADFLTALQNTKEWTIKPEYVKDPTGPTVRILIREINLIYKFVAIYWQYRSASNDSELNEQNIFFIDFLKKFEPLKESTKEWKENSLVEEAQSEGLKLYYCQKWNGLCKIKECLIGNELSNVVFSNPGNKYSWYDFKGYGYMQNEPIKLSFVNGKSKELGNIDYFIEGCAFKEPAENISLHSTDVKISIQKVEEHTYSEE